MLTERQQLIAKCILLFPSRRLNTIYSKYDQLRLWSYGTYGLRHWQSGMTVGLWLPINSYSLLPGHADAVCLIASSIFVFRAVYQYVGVDRL